MADLVSEIISQQAIDQLEFANSQLELAVKNVNNVANAAKGITIDFKGAANIGELNATLAKQEQAIKDLETATKKYEGAVNARQRAVDIAERNELLAIQKVIAEREKAAKQLELSEKQKQQAAEREEKALAKLNNAYEQLKVQYKQAADEAKRLGAEFGVMDSRAVAASGNAMKLYNSLLAVEKSVGQAQRQVGQYNQAAFAMQQILRETPAFAYSFATGISAISNNIPPLIDALKQAKKENDALVASGGTSIPIWKTLGKELLSFGGIATILVGVGTIVAAQWKNISAFFKKSGDELNDYRVIAGKNAAEEMANAKALSSIAANTKQSMNLRIEAVKELQSLYPNYLGNMSQEAILVGNTADAMERLNKALINKSIMESYTEKLGEQAAKYVETQEELVKYEKKLKDADALFNSLNTGSTNQYAVNAKVRAAQDSQNAQKEIDNIKKRAKTIESEMVRLQNQANKFANLAAGVLLGKSKEPKAKKEKAVKDTTLKSESDLLRAEYELAKQRIEQDAQIQKDISDNTKNELNKRLDAYMEYQSALFQLSVLERDFIVKQEDLKIEDLKRKRATAKGTEIANINEQIKAAETRKKTAEEKTAGDFVAIQKKSADDRLKIVETSNDAFITAQQELYKNLTEGEIAQYLQEEKLLLNALETKEMSRREYNKRLAELQKKQQIAFLQAEIEFDEKILSNQSLTAEKRLQYEEKLNKDKEALFKAQKGVTAPKRGNFRITDSIAKLFVPSEGLDNEEQYLQEFYDRTVDLANKAADAIIEAKNRQYEAEMDRLDKQAEAVRNNYEQQSLFIQNTVRDENDRYNQQQKLLAQTQAQEATIEQQKREVAKRQAAAQKTAAIAAIIQNTAIAVAGALKYGPAAPPIIALIAAAGAVQLAAAANTPIPAYKEGTDNHKGGKFYAGDGGEKELIVSPNKAPYWSKNVTTMYDEPAGTKVIPKSVIDYAMSNTTANTSSLSAAYEAHSNALFAKVVGDIVGRQFEATGRKLAYVIQDNKPTPPKSESIREELSKIRNLQGL